MVTQVGEAGFGSGVDILKDQSHLCVCEKGMIFFRTVGFIQFSLSKHHPNSVTVSSDFNKSIVLLDLTFIVTEGPLEYKADTNSGSYVCAL